MNLMFQCAARSELLNEQRNPVALVRVKGGSKRGQRPAILTADQFQSIVSQLKEPFCTMVLVAQCLGLRASEIAALQWDDFDRNFLLVQRSFVNGRIDDVKTEYFQDHVPVHDSLLQELLNLSKDCPPTEEGWVFANPFPAVRITRPRSRSDTSSLWASRWAQRRWVGTRSATRIVRGWTRPGLR